MGCNFTEDGLEKCFEYFPLDGKITTDSFEIFLIKCTQKFQNLTERVIMISHAASENYRMVLHLHCTAWPDLLVPSLSEEFHSLCYILGKIDKK